MWRAREREMRDSERGRKEIGWEKVEAGRERDDQN